MLMIGFGSLAVSSIDGQTKIAVEPYQKPDESSYDRSQLSGIRDYAAFQQGKNVIVLAENGSTRYVIHVDAKATPAEQYAANTLADYLKQITKAEFRVVKVRPANTPVIAVGPDAAMHVFPSIPDFETLGHDGIALRTEGADLLLTGAPTSRRGTVYAVITFLENIGCRWWTDTESFVPQRSKLTIPFYKLKYRPALDMRDVHSYFMNNFAVYNKLNGNEYKIPEDRGGRVEYKGPFFVHTFGQIVSCKEYAATHPQWFAEVNGKRQFGKWDGKSAGHVDNSQLCMSTNHTDLIELIISKVRGYLKDAPPDSIVSLSQNDGDGSGKCECVDCAAVEKEEGSPSGPILRFVNIIAADIEKDFPQAKIDTLAYQYSEKPPAITKPRANVVVRLCAWNRTINLAPYDSKVNERFGSAIIGWSKIAPAIHIWDYTTDFWNYSKQFPSIFATCYNMRLFARNGVKSVLLQSSFNTRAGDMTDLKHWIYAKILWDQQLDEKALIKEFISGYYAEGAPYVQRYIDILYACDPLGDEYIKAAFLDKAYALYTAGRMAVKNDAQSLKRFELAFMPVLNAVMVNWPVLRQECEGKPWPFPEKAAALADEYIRICSENNVVKANEAGETTKQWGEKYRAGLRVGKPGESLTAKRVGKPAEEFKHIAAADKREIQDDLFRLQQKGKSSFIVNDEKASDGYAVSMPSTHTEWAVQVPLAIMPPKEGASGKWKIYAEIKIKKTGDAGSAFEAGVYDTYTKKYPAKVTLNVQDVKGADYHSYLIGSMIFDAGVFIYIAPTKNPENVKEVIVDRIMLIRDE